MPARVTRSYVDGPYGQMHVRSAGLPSSKPTLVCFHMSPMSSRTFARFLAEMGEDRRAIAIDTPGFGMSDGPPAPPSIHDYAAAMIAAMDALGVSGPADLMGYHTGLMIAAEIAADWPARARRLLLISAPIFDADDRAQLRAQYAPQSPALDGSHLVERWRSFVHHHLNEGATLEDIADAFPERLLGRANAWWGHRAAFDHAPDMRLGEIEHPILVINPGDDLTDYTRRAGVLLRNGSIVERPAWGHGFLDAHTAEAAALARAFLDADG